MRAFQDSPSLDKQETTLGGIPHSGESDSRSFFYRPHFQMDVPRRKSPYELYNEHTVKLDGIDHPEIAYAEHNEPNDVSSLCHLLGTFLWKKRTTLLDLENGMWNTTVKKSSRLLVTYFFAVGREPCDSLTIRFDIEKREK